MSDERTREQSGCIYRYKKKICCRHEVWLTVALVYVAYSEVEEQMFGQMGKRAPRIAHDDLLDRLNNYEKAQP